MNINTKYYAAYIGDLAMYTSYNIDFYNLDDSEIKCIKHGILVNTEFACFIRKEYLGRDKYNFIKHWVSRIICFDQIKEPEMRVFKPFYLWITPVPKSNTFKSLLNNYSHLKYNVGKALIMYADDYNKFNKIYFEYDFEPELELFKSAALTCNEEVYNDQLEKAKKLGYFYIYLDMENEIVLEKPNKIDYKNINVELSFDISIYDFLKVDFITNNVNLPEFDSKRLEIFKEDYEEYENFDC
jgi:hypothetical protein